ncbi:MAG TPA: hypothetical protein VK589_00645 [Chryseolinea sp.]|nr:hypothetical protein [Chryseolinea sp.]
MNQQPDELFREKLEGYQKPAPASAWEKIAAAQSKKNDKWLWLKIAASIALVAVVGYISWPDTNTEVLSKESLTKPAEEKTSEQVPASDEKLADVKKESQPSATSDQPSTQTSKQKKTNKKMAPPKVDVKKLNVADVVEEEILPLQNETHEEIALVETVTQPQLEDTPVVTKVEAHNMTLVYSAKDVEEYLDKKSLAEATSDSKKSSTLKKLLKKANDLTNNQDPFGELRQKKNEILALNFKSEKQRGQNK